MLDLKHKGQTSLSWFTWFLSCCPLQSYFICTYQNRWGNMVGKVFDKVWIFCQAKVTGSVKHIMWQSSSYSSCLNKHFLLWKCSANEGLLPLLGLFKNHWGKSSPSRTTLTCFKTLCHEVCLALKLLCFAPQAPSSLAKGECLKPCLNTVQT